MSRTTKSLILILIMLMVSLLSACKTGSEINEAATEQAKGIIDGDSAYPINTKEVSSGTNDEMYPIIIYDATSNFPETLEVPEPRADTGVVIGKVLSISAGDKPYLNGGLYLGSYIAPKEGGENAPLLVGISPDEDPNAQRARDGSFAFSDVPPGTYGLFLCTPMSAILMIDAKTDQYVNVEVVAGEVVDLGTIYVP